MTEAERLIANLRNNEPKYPCIDRDKYLTAFDALTAEVSALHEELARIGGLTAPERDEVEAMLLRQNERAAEQEMRAHHAEGERDELRAALEQRDAALRGARAYVASALVFVGKLEDYSVSGGPGISRLDLQPVRADLNNARRALATGGDEPTTYDHRFSLAPGAVCGCERCVTTEPEEARDGKD